SSTYPSLLVLRHHRRRGAAAGELPATARRAEHHVRAGYERLLGYQHDSGAFTYWGGASEPDLALTAYALRFLHDAGEVLEVDEDATLRARDYVLAQQQPDGSWSADAKAPAHTLALTAYVARVLASYEAAKGANDKGAHKTDAETAKASDALKRALDFLSRHAEKTGDPYALASYALAARDSGRHEAARAAAVKLAALRRDVAGDTFWDTTNTTPFNGWGHAGRIEATALVLKALVVNCGMATADCGLKGVDGGAASAAANRQLINGGLLYLLRHKDEHGVWYSTQATVNVLDALATLPSNPSNDVARDAQAAASSARAATAEVFVNSRHVGSLALPAEGELSAPLSLDITRFVNAPGVNRVEIKRPAGAGRAAAQVVTNYYVPWSDAPDVAPLTKDARGTGAPAGARAAGRPLLKIAFDRTEGQAGRPVTCRVEVSRGASLGGGMLLAEVGLPPGAEVDRASLERASKKSGAFLDRYDVLPDRLVLYVWPHQDKAASFEFEFTPRYGLRALTAPSQVYDYYNPEARTVVPPTRFVIR
ncbi:MAG TPA: hypothetical protein VE360_08830, partial [Pyrinomonadaceae bacterium]|nr:hypothetical protein [Pyrinomonadaceae bacterium]